MARRKRKPDRPSGPRRWGNVLDCPICRMPPTVYSAVIGGLTQCKIECPRCRHIVTEYSQDGDGDPCERVIEKWNRFWANK